MDVLSKSDPMVVVYMKRGPGWAEIGRTEMIKYALRSNYFPSPSSRLRTNCYFLFPDPRFCNFVMRQTEKFTFFVVV